MTEGKKRLALVLAAVAVLGALAGCGDRRGARSGTPGEAPNAVSSTSAGTEPVAGGGGATDLSSVDAEISSANSMLNEIDSDLSAADQAPVDAD